MDSRSHKTTVNSSEWRFPWTVATERSGQGAITKGIDAAGFVSELMTPAAEFDLGPALRQKCHLNGSLKTAVAIRWRRHVTLQSCSGINRSRHQWLAREAIVLLRAFLKL